MRNAHMASQTWKSPRGRSALLVVAVVLGIFMSGCGGGSNTQSQTSASQAASTPATTGTTASTAATDTGASTATTPAPKPAAPRHLPTLDKIGIGSPVVPADGAVPARYTCDGANEPLPLQWEDIPAGTKELMLDVIKYSPVNGKLFFAWAVTGLRPTSRGIAAGKLPAGAIPGLNSTGSRAYSLCPPKGPKEAYVVVLFALPRHLAAKPGFDPAKLRHEANETANYEGQLGINYQRH